MLLVVSDEIWTSFERYRLPNNGKPTNLIPDYSIPFITRFNMINVDPAGKRLIVVIEKVERILYRPCRPVLAAHPD